VIIYRYRLSLCSAPHICRGETGKFHNSVVVEIRKPSVPQFHTSGATDAVRPCGFQRRVFDAVKQTAVQQEYECQGQWNWLLR
jgi:hypothetical protein